MAGPTVANIVDEMQKRVDAKRTNKCSQTIKSESIEYSRMSGRFTTAVGWPTPSRSFSRISGRILDS